MSFITKRERVFNEYDLYDLPARNEGKLKAYASCTDARAWSHFCSDKSEHLVEIIKRNNDSCKPKYVPTEAIVNTLLAHKHAEIVRLKRKIEEFERMLAAYDELELTSEQKSEIALAHASIKEANKDLNELWFDLDLSGFTGIDSEDYETGKSRGDEPSKYRDSDETPRSKGDDWSFEKEPSQKETKSNQAGGMSCHCDASTNAVDPRIEELQDNLISKDAKLNAMKNTIAVMENDVCEPYCIYAHIYTALEKIFGILCQNDKYKLYLDLMTAGKNTRGIDIKGKILFKLKVLEKFSMALIAPCSQDMVGNSSTTGRSDQECSCYRAEFAFALTSAETQQPNLDNKRAQLVADIMENDEMKQILNKESTSIKTDHSTDDIVIENYNINEENLKRLKNLQANYDELMTCYEALKHEKDCLQIRCWKYDELEKEFEGLQTQLRDYNTLWNEKEHYRKRSLDLDTLKEQYMVLCDETTSLETELNAESKVNDVKTKTIEELRNDNIVLEKKLHEASITFEKEKNCAQCKLKESECTIMCQGQQIKSLSLQIDRLLEQGPDKVSPKQPEGPAIALIDEINSLKEQITNLKDALYCSEEEKQQLQEEYQNKLNLINDLKIELEDWKSNYEKTLQRNDYLEKYTDSFQEEVQKLIEKNKTLSQDNAEKSNAIDNLINVINNKSQEVHNLMEDIKHKTKENDELYNEVHNLHEAYNKNITTLDTEKMETMKSLQIARQESQELLEKVKDYEDIVNKQDDLSHSYQAQIEEYNRLKSLLINTQQENEKLQLDLANRENNNAVLLQEIQRLQEINAIVASNVSSLQDEKQQYKLSLELTRKDSKLLENKLQNFDDLSYQMQQLKESHEKLIQEKIRLETELNDKEIELNNAIQTIQLKMQEREELEDKLLHSENSQLDVNDAYLKMTQEQQQLQLELTEKEQDLNNLLEAFNNLKTSNEHSSKEVEALFRELTCLKETYNALLEDKNNLQNDLANTTSILESKIVENKEVNQQLKHLEHIHKALQNNMHTLQEENFSTKNALNALRLESDELMDRVKYYESLESEYEKLKNEYDIMQSKNNKLQNELDKRIGELKRVQEDNQALNSESQILLSHSEDLEKALINARSELVDNASPSNLQIGIMKEIEQMRREKASNHIKIRDLLDKLDESENIISNLSEDVSARDSKIAILENHINELQDEVRRLHLSLAEIVDTGEQIKDNSLQRIRESLSSMEAHHSKATHNMKMELAKLQSDNIKLEERYSISKMKSQDSARNLLNEREIIVTDIKQLEMNCVGNSALSPDNCDVEDILGSLDRIRRYVDTKRSKSISLEQTLLKVQNSYQVVQNKADEAKKIVEKEKQKILNEKEEAVRDRISMEKQLTDLKEQLAKQMLCDKSVIKDLEAEILNQKLITDKLNNTTKSYISKLKEEMQSLKELYEKSIEDISELEKRLQYMNDEENTKLKIIENINKKLAEQSAEINMLNKDLERLNNKPSHSLGIQALVLDNRDEEIQTNKDLQYEKIFGYDQTDKLNNLGEILDINPVNKKKITGHDRNIPQSDNLKHVNEVQVFTADVEPTLDYIRNSYLNYKLHQLKPGRLEHFSISGMSEDDDKLDYEGVTIEKNKESYENPNTSYRTENVNVIDIYNKQSMLTNSSKNNDSNYTENDKNLQAVESPGKIISGITDFGLTNESFDATSSVHKTSNLFGSVSGISTDKDLFIIYKDSDSNYANKPYDKKSWVKNGRSELLVKAVAKDSDSDNRNQLKNKMHFKKKLNQYDDEKDSSEHLKSEPINEDDSVKHKLKISLPRVQTDSPTIDTVSDTDKKSIDSYSIFPVTKSTYSSSDHKMEKVQKIKSQDFKTSSVHSLSHDGTQYLESYYYTQDENLVHALNKKQRSAKDQRNDFVATSDSMHLNELTNGNTSLGSTFIKNRFESDSHHKLSRVDADVRLIKNKAPEYGKPEKKSKTDFGLNYILATVQADPNNIKTYNAANSLRIASSHEQMDSIKLKSKSDTSPTRNRGLKSSTDYKTESNYNHSNVYEPSKTFTTRGVMAKLDSVEEYENKIKYLTSNLENIEKDYKKKIEAIKMQYDSNIKNILKEHNEGVTSIQNLHEETLEDIIKHHENEVENLRSMSIDAMRKSDKLEREIRTLKCSNPACSSTRLNEEPIRISSAELKKHRKSGAETRTLTKTHVEAFNVRPKSRSTGPCTCSLDINLSDTIRNIFEQVDVEQRKVAEHTYLKYIANKILNDTVEALDCQELSFLHLKVCRIWKVKLTKEETLQKRIDSLEAELMSKQRYTQHNMAELDRKVAEERRRLQEVREAVCRNVPTAPRLEYIDTNAPLDKESVCNCNTGCCNLKIGERQSAGDLGPAVSGTRQKRARPDNNRAVAAKLDAEERREKKLYTDEPPTRLRRPHDRQLTRSNKK